MAQLGTHSSDELIRFIEAASESANIDAKGPMEWDGGEAADRQTAGSRRMIDFLIVAAIVVPVVLGAAWWLFSRLHRADERRVMAFASRLNCPTCGVSDFVWTAQWAVNEPDMEEEVGGDTLLCNQCGKEFHITEDGKEFHHPSLDETPEG